MTRILWAALIFCAPVFSQCTKLVLNPVTHKLDCNDGAGATLSYQLLGSDGASQTARNRLNLIGGTNIALTPADNPGTNSTDLTISSTASGNMTNSSVAGTPSANCAAGITTALETNNHDLWFCSQTNTWKKLLSTTNVGAFVITGATGTVPSSPASGFLSLWMSTATGSLHSVNSSGTDTDYASPATLHSITFSIDGGGSVITTGDIGFYPAVNFACTINRIDISGSPSGSVTVDTWKAAGAIPTSGNKISASAPLTLSSSQLSQNGSRTGWTNSVSVGDVFGFSVASATTVTKVSGILWCQ